MNIEVSPGIGPSSELLRHAPPWSEPLRGSVLSVLSDEPPSRLLGVSKNLRLCFKIASFATQRSADAFGNQLSVSAH